MHLVADLNLEMHRVLRVRSTTISEKLEELSKA